jgi:3-hydroxybutyryl-CoA dehydrogenase
MQETGDPALGPKKSIIEKFNKGEWGRKTGKGWYDYTKNPEGSSRATESGTTTTQRGERA